MIFKHCEPCWIAKNCSLSQGSLLAVRLACKSLKVGIEGVREKRGRTEEESLLFQLTVAVKFPPFPVDRLGTLYSTT